mgnify:FL=1
MKPEQYAQLVHARKQRAQAITDAGGFEEAYRCGALSRRADMTVSEALVLGLVRQNVRKFLSVFGHGSTEIGEVLRVYEAAGVVRTFAVRNEIAASHAAAALRWVTGEKAAVVTSIGPGALQAMTGSLAAASDGLGVWYLFGDETTEDEGPNMQQIPKPEQGLFLRLGQTMGSAYTLHTPGAVPTALRRGLNRVDDPHRAGPFFLLMPMNTQCCVIEGFNLDELPVGSPPRLGPAADDGRYDEAVEILRTADRVVVKIGGGARHAGREVQELLELTDGVAVTSPLVSGVIPYAHPRNMTVGGSKGSLCGNWAMEQADVLVAIGTRFVCQSDCSRTGYPKVRRVIAIDADAETAMHYSRTIGMVGDAKATLEKLCQTLLAKGVNKGSRSTPWFQACAEKKREWEAFKAQRYGAARLFDPVWKREVLTQPAAIKAATDWARSAGAVTFFDAGDVQANGFQIVEDERLGQTFTETGASYMGFGVCALLTTAVADQPFFGLALSGDGSFTMNPQILIDAVEHGAIGCIVLLDNRRMGAISGLQTAQYGNVYASSDSVEVDYAAWARSVKGVRGVTVDGGTDELVKQLNEAKAYKGLTLIHVPVYFGEDELGGMGVFGRWNVGNWCHEVQALRHQIGT